MIQLLINIHLESSSSCICFNQQKPISSGIHFEPRKTSIQTPHDKWGVTTTIKVGIPGKKQVKTICATNMTKLPSVSPDQNLCWKESPRRAIEKTTQPAAAAPFPCVAAQRQLSQTTLDADGGKHGHLAAWSLGIPWLWAANSQLFNGWTKVGVYPEKKWHWYNIYRYRYPTPMGGYSQ